MRPWNQRDSGPSSAAACTPCGQVGAFGKLPIAGDFIQVRASGEPVASFANWLQRGMAWADEHGPDQWQLAYRAGLVHAFVYHAVTPPSEAAMVGVLRPNVDAAGRLFPWAVLSKIATSDIARAPHLLPLMMGDFLELATDALMDNDRIPNLAELERNLDRVPPPSFDAWSTRESDHQRWAASTKLCDVWPILFGSAPPIAAWNAVNLLREAILPFRGQEHPTTPLGLRLPLGWGGLHAVAFWVDLLRRAGAWRATIPTMFWFSSESTGWLVLYPGHPTARAVTELWLPDPNSDNVCELTQPPTNVTYESLARRMPARLVAVLSQHESTPLQLFEAIAD